MDAGGVEVVEVLGGHVGDLIDGVAEEGGAFESGVADDAFGVDGAPGVFVEEDVVVVEVAVEEGGLGGGFEEFDAEVGGVGVVGF